MAYSDERKRIEIMASSFMDEPNIVVPLNKWETLREWVLQYKSDHEPHQKTDIFKDEFGRFSADIVLLYLVMKS